jgi:hypothetical protein
MASNIPIKIGWHHSDDDIKLQNQMTTQQSKPAIIAVCTNDSTR